MNKMTKRMAMVTKEAHESNFVVIDTETTGFDKNAEILQFSAFDKTGKQLMDIFIKPSHTTSWVEAQKVNGISPEDVADCKTMDECVEDIVNLLTQYDIIAGYNTQFDMRMLVQNGAPIGDMPIFDIMKMFAPIYGEAGRYGDYKWQKLGKCAEFYGYKGNGWHNSAEDVIATLFCFDKMAEEANKILSE